ncbi:hypothetical protein HGP14_28645 [Rhizobium sp. P32RR-XVIII]|uniref:capsid staple protein n=1 Tax=Rhizobium sp. P32RR-XVIII TaxID=2726738 RepID=UPI001456F22E|nr:hypothetical protein [Rhizobium sp. P32RR-XVIII]NLS07263.1 hypothetical protein [Rhizobium sp. P32RR-XVIII]
MATMVDLARTAAEKKEELDRWEKGPTESDRPDYAYGLTLFLDYTTLKKMSLTDRDFDSGQPVTIMAHAMITEDRIEIVNGEKRHSISLQVQKMALEQETKDVADKFYAEKASA